MERGNLVVVYWWDIAEDASWQSIAKIEREYEPPLCKSVGWFLSENKMCIKILHCISGIDDAGIEASSSVIPKAVIRNIELIREDELDTE